MKKIGAFLITGLVLATIVFLILNNTDLLTNAGEEIPPEGKKVLFSKPLQEGESQLGIKINKSTGNELDRYDFPASLAVRNGNIFISDPVHQRVVVFNQKGELQQEIVFPKKSLMDIGVDGNENVYAVNYKDQELYIYQADLKKVKVNDSFEFPHAIDVTMDWYHVLDFDPDKPGNIRLQTFDKKGNLVSNNSQKTWDINLFPLKDYENARYEIKIAKGKKRQLAEQYEIVKKKADQVTNTMTYTPDYQQGSYYKNLRVLGFDEQNRLYILREKGPKIDQSYDFYGLQDVTEVFVDILDMTSGTVETRPLEKNRTLYGPGANAHRFVIDKQGNIYQAKITKSELQVVKYYNQQP